MAGRREVDVADGRRPRTRSGTGAPDGWWWALALGYTAVLASRIALDTSFARAVWRVAIIWPSVALMTWAVLAGWRAGRDMAAWGWVTAALAVFGIGPTVQLALGQIGPSPIAPAAGVLCLPLLARGLRRMAAPAPDPSGAGLIDVVIVSLALTAAWWVWVVGAMGPARVPSGGRPLGVVLTAGLFVLLVRWCLRLRGMPADRALAAAAVLLGLLFVLLQMAASGAVGTGMSGPLLLLIGAAHACLALGALHPAAGTPAAPPQVPPGAEVRLLAVAGALVVPFTVEASCAAGFASGCGTTSMVLAGAVTGLGSVRLFGAILSGLRVRRSLDAHERLHLALVEHAQDGVVVFDGDGVLTYATPSLVPLSGEADLVGMQGTATLVPEDRERALAAFREAASAPGRVAEVVVHPRLRPDRALEMRITDHRGEPAIAGFVANVRDVSDAVTHEATLRRLSREDVLTGLRNRAALLEDVEAALDDDIGSAAVLFCDLDRLKAVNDRHGHAVGDALLAAAAARLRDVVDPGALVGRLGGDEFVVFLPGRDAPRAASTAEAIRTAMAQPFDVGGLRIRASCSVGVAEVQPGRTAEAAIAEADAALYRAKDRGRDQVVVYDAVLREEHLRRRMTGVELPRAVAGGELHVVYQPIVRVDDVRHRAAEALVRWRHPTHGTLLPRAFIDVAEESGLILAIGEQVLGESVAALAATPDLTTVSVNLSPVQLASADIVSTVADLLDVHGVAADRLLLEVTETVLILPQSAAVHRLEALRAMGVRVALDDFGSGYASFASLGALPLDVLKVDRSLLADRGAQPLMLDAVVAMAHAMGLEVVVEGVEQAGQLAAAIAVGADMVQGHLLGRPGALEALPDAIPLPVRVV